MAHGDLKNLMLEFRINDVLDSYLGFYTSCPNYSRITPDIIKMFPDTNNAEELGEKIYEKARTTFKWSEDMRFVELLLQSAAREILELKESVYR